MLTYYSNLLEGKGGLVVLHPGGTWRTRCWVCRGGRTTFGNVSFTLIKNNFGMTPLLIVTIFLLYVFKNLLWSWKAPWMSCSVRLLQSGRWGPVLSAESGGPGARGVAGRAGQRRCFGEPRSAAPPGRRQCRPAVVPPGGREPGADVAGTAAQPLALAWSWQASGLQWHLRHPQAK